MNCTIRNMYDLTHTIASPLLEKYEYPWEALPHIGDFIRETGPSLDKDIYEDRGDDIYIAKTVRFVNEATNTIIGPCIIGPGTEVRPGAFIRGNAIIGADCVVGNSTEIKNDIIFDNVEVPHYNYVGDSVLGFHAHMGAGSITSNIKSDRTNVVIKDFSTGEEIETGLRKIGAMLGDYAEVGCNTVMNPGSVIGAHTNIYPLSMIRGVIPPDSIVKNRAAHEIVSKK
ncbi:MAG: UDP-N-acetylglucosamine pyrophosphorylase [Lachnospiraceae bacterium]|nr:UDP-N-acetylglucosamine pyrophosphorylase [Lachnospiraceae bacterium]MDD7327827.1 UDP-N-acetylglucosamine pyrophosphorylase [Lachnospiraceae bacterium]MDY2760097.1 UDP-N-acetylglucosamine pyrophosphorylase [Lachnospiraceae bacterium]